MFQLENLLQKEGFFQLNSKLFNKNGRFWYLLKFRLDLKTFVNTAILFSKYIHVKLCDFFQKVMFF